MEDCSRIKTMSKLGQPFIVKFGDINPPGVVKFARLENMLYGPEDRITVYATKDLECAALYGIKDQRQAVTLTLFLKEVRLQNNAKLELPDLLAWTTTAICDQ